MREEKEAIKLIDRLYRDLYLNDQVLHHGSGNRYDKFNNIKEYLEKLEEIHTRIGETERHKGFLKKCYYAKYVINKEDIPESYYHHQKEIALERGYGHIEMNENNKKLLQQEVIENQKRSLDTWLDYFLSEDAKVYPFWAKYWAFQGMLKIGSFDKEKREFKSRSKNTVAPFCDLNREALAMSIDMVTRMLEHRPIEEKELDVLIKTGSFSKIYSYVLNKVLNNNQNIIKRNTGKWVKYNQGSDHMPLVNSLQGYNTGWCTAGESTAKSQLEGGDFYVYYTLDEQEEYKVPRIAIRMEGNKIGEIRGIAKDQNIESEMEEVVEEKLKEFPDKEEYYKKVADMKELTKIYKKHQQQEELTKEELTFLYEINGKIKGFGYQDDPRIEEIKSKRKDKKEDLSYILNCDKSQIALRKYEIDENTIYYDGNLDLDAIIDARDLKLPKYIKGYLDLSGLTSADDLILPCNVEGCLELYNLTSANGLVLPQSIGEDLYLNRLTSAEGLVLPQSIGGDLNLSSLTSAKGLILPESIGGSLFLNGLTSSDGLILPQSIGGFLILDELQTAEGLALPKNIGGCLDLRGLISAKGLILPKIISCDLYLNGLQSAEGLNLPESIGGSLNLHNLKSAKGLVLPQNINVDLDLRSLTSAEGLALPQSVGGDLDLRSLINAKNLLLPQIIDGDLHLWNLISAEGLVLPQTLGGYLDLKSLTSAEGLIIPEPLTYNINMNGFTITPENVEQYRNNKSKQTKSC